MSSQNFGVFPAQHTLTRQLAKAKINALITGDDYNYFGRLVVMRKLFFLCLALASCKNNSSEGIAESQTANRRVAIDDSGELAREAFSALGGLCREFNRDSMFCSHIDSEKKEGMWLVWFDKESINQNKLERSYWEGDINVYFRHKMGISWNPNTCKTNTEDANVRINEAIVKSTTQILSTEGILITSKKESCKGRENCFFVPELFPEDGFSQSTRTRKFGWELEVAMTTRTKNEKKDEVLYFGNSSNGRDTTTIKGKVFSTWDSKEHGVPSRCDD